MSYHVQFYAETPAAALEHLSTPSHEHVPVEIKAKLRTALENAAPDEMVSVSASGHLHSGVHGPGDSWGNYEVRSTRLVKARPPAEVPLSGADAA